MIVFIGFRGKQCMSVGREASLHLNVKVGFWLLNHYQMYGRRRSLHGVQPRSAEGHEHEAERLQVLVAQSDGVLG